MASVLLTGASSEIGGAVARRLARGHRLICLAHRRPVEVEGVEVESLPGGLAAVSRHRERIRAADRVLHLAAVTHSDSPEAYFEVNTEGTRRLLEACRPDQPFIFVSTRCVGAEGGAYSHSKELAEEAVAGSGRPHAIVRPAEVYGSHSGEGIDSLLALARRFRILPDFRWRGPVTYSPISVGELAAFLTELTLSTPFGAGVYALTNAREYTAKEIQRALRAKLGKAIVRVPVPVRLLLLAAALPLPLPFKRDQVARLVMRKASGDARAARFGFAPRDFLDWLGE